VVGAIADAPQSGQAAVLFNPQLSASELLERSARANVNLVRFGGVPGALIVDLPDADALSRLRAAGAWVIADPIVLGGCVLSSSASPDESTERLS